MHTVITFSRTDLFSYYEQQPVFQNFLILLTHLYMNFKKYYPISYAYPMLIHLLHFQELTYSVIMFFRT